MVRGQGWRLLGIALCLVVGCARDEAETRAVEDVYDAGDEMEPSVDMDAGVHAVADSGSTPVAPQPDSGMMSSATFDDCAELASYARDHALELVEASPTGSPYATPTPVCFTCLVIPNPDAFLFAEPRWHHLAGDPGYGGRLAVRGDTAFGMFKGSLLAAKLDGEEINLTDISVGFQIFAAGDRLMYIDRGATPTLVEVDVSEPLEPKVVRKRELGGTVIDARIDAGVLRLATYSRPEALGLLEAATEGERPSAREHNRAAIMDADATAWLPRFTDIAADGDRAPAAAYFECSDVRRPPERAGMSMLSLVEIDVASGLDSWHATGMLLEAPELHAIDGRLFVLARPWRELSSKWILPEAERPAHPSTLIHGFDLTGSTLRSLGDALLVEGAIQAMTPGTNRRLYAFASTEFGYGWPGYEQGAQSSSLLSLTVGSSGLTATQGGAFGTDSAIGIVAAGETLYAPSARNEQPAYTFDVSDPEEPAIGPEVDLLGPWVQLVPSHGERGIAIGHAVDAAWNYGDAESYLAVLGAEGVATRLDLDRAHIAGSGPIVLDDSGNRLVACGNDIAGGVGAVACLAFALEGDSAEQLGVIQHPDPPGAGTVGSGFGPAAIFAAVLLEDRVVTLSHDQLLVSALPSLEMLHAYDLR